MADENPTAGSGRTPLTKAEAQHRADRIRAFTSELTTLEQDNVLRLSDEQRRAIAKYHGDFLRELDRFFDIDVSSAAKQISIGMRIVSFIGVLALSAAVYFSFQRFFVTISTSIQVIIVVAVPLLLLSGVVLAARRERTLYLAFLISMAALSAFFLSFTVFGWIFNISTTRHAFLAGGGLALIIAYTYRLRLLLVAGLLCLLCGLSATMVAVSGCYWLTFVGRPENLVAIGLAIIAASFIHHPRHREFTPVYRMFGLLTVLTAVLVMSNWGGGSYLMIAEKTVEHLYQITGFVFSGLTVWLGVRQRWSGAIHLGSIFFVIFLYTRFYDWWWGGMPNYLFFLLLGAIALLILFILKKLRSLIREVAP